MEVNGVKYVRTTDKELRESIQEGLKRTGGYCPCMIERSLNTKCPCVEFKTTGNCHCGLYVKEESQ